MASAADSAPPHCGGSPSSASSPSPAPATLPTLNTSPPSATISASRCPSPGSDAVAELLRAQARHADHAPDVELQRDVHQHRDQDREGERGAELGGELRGLGDEARPDGAGGHQEHRAEQGSAGGWTSVPHGSTHGGLGTTGSRERSIDARAHRDRPRYGPSRRMRKIGLAVLGLVAALVAVIAVRTVTYRAPAALDSQPVAIAAAPASRPRGDGANTWPRPCASAPSATRIRPRTMRPSGSASTPGCRSPTPPRMPP